MYKMAQDTNNQKLFRPSNENSLQKSKRNTMASCYVRFSGQYDQEAVENFLKALETFKESEAIDDKDALEGVSLLFTDTASLWWQGVRRETQTWEDFVRLLREHFAPVKAPYQIYMEIFNTRQEFQMGITQFVIEKRALLSQLPQGRHDEECQIDMIYGLIHYKYRQMLKRTQIRTFKELLQQGREIEQSHLEAANEEKALKPKRCSHCNYRGHTTEECRRKQLKQPPASASEGLVKQ